MLLEDVTRYQSVVRAEVDGIVVRLDDRDVDDEKLESIADISANHRGEQKLLFEVTKDAHTFFLRSEGAFGVTVSPDLLDELSSVVGSENLSFTRR